MVFREKSFIFMILIVLFTYIQFSSWSIAQGIYNLPTIKNKTISNKITNLLGICTLWFGTNVEQRKLIFADIKRLSYPNQRLMEHRTGCVAFCVLLMMGFFIPNDKGLVSISRSVTLEHSIAFFKNITEEAYGPGVLSDSLTEALRLCFPYSHISDLNLNCRIWKDTINCMMEKIENVMRVNWMQAYALV